MYETVRFRTPLIILNHKNLVPLNLDFGQNGLTWQLAQVKSFCPKSNTGAIV